MNNLIHTPEREADLQKLCQAVLNQSPECFDNPNGAYETTCPYCFAKEERGGGGNIWATMAELKHLPNCEYLIAKDLATSRK